MRRQFFPSQVAGGARWVWMPSRISRNCHIIRETFPPSSPRLPPRRLGKYFGEVARMLIATPRLNLMFERHCMHSLLLLQLQPLSLSIGSGPSSNAHRKRVMRTQAGKRQAGHVACGGGVDDNRLSPMRPTRGDLHPPIIGWISQRSRHSQSVHPIRTRCILGDGVKN